MNQEILIPCKTKRAAMTLARKATRFLDAAGNCTVIMIARTTVWNVAVPVFIADAYPGILGLLAEAK